MPREFYVVVLRENFRRRHLDPAYRYTVRWALARIRDPHFKEV